MKQKKSLGDGDGKEEEESRCELEREECKEKMPKLLCLFLLFQLCFYFEMGTADVMRLCSKKFLQLKHYFFRKRKGTQETKLCCAF